MGNTYPRILSIILQSRLSKPDPLMSAPEPPLKEPTKRREPLLISMAKLFGLAVAVLLAGTLFELVSGSALPLESFRSGMAYAYLAGASILIAFSTGTGSWKEAANRASIVSVLGLLAWMVVGAGVSVFDAVAGLTGVWYTTIVRRI